MTKSRAGQVSATTAAEPTAADATEPHSTSKTRKTPQNYAAPRGMRDFYPEAFREREQLFDAWRSAALAFGFEFVDAPVVESLSFIERKAGEEISEQLYAFNDKSGRPLALRGEFTPTLARMLLARPELLRTTQKWAAIAQCFRYERMSAGRRREHYQWNLDVIGATSALAEVDVIGTAVAALQNLGFTSDDYAVRLGSRPLLGELYVHFDLPAERFRDWSRIVDKQDKMPRASLSKEFSDAGFTENDISATFSILDIRSLADVALLLGESSPALVELQEFFELAEVAGLSAVVVFDPTIVRGLDYYTGIVFEAFDRAGQLRALFGGGRYNDLLATLGGPSTPCVGLGFGDVVVTELRAHKGAAAPQRRALDFIVGYLDTETSRTAALTLARQLRRAGARVDLVSDSTRARNFFRRADRSAATYAIFIGPDEVAGLQAQQEQEVARWGALTAKVMASGQTIALSSAIDAAYDARRST